MSYPNAEMTLQRSFQCLWILLLLPITQSARRYTVLVWVM